MNTISLSNLNSGFKDSFTIKSILLISNKDNFNSNFSIISLNVLI